MVSAVATVILLLSTTVPYRIAEYAGCASLGS
jgi:hypothetical protein